jgi:hypothetical protein
MSLASRCESQASFAQQGQSRPEKRVEGGVFQQPAKAVPGIGLACLRP